MSEQVTVVTMGLSSLALLGFVARLTFPYWMKTIDKKDAYIQQITAEFRQSVDRFGESHNRLAAGIEAQNKATNAQTEVFKQLIKR